MLPPPPTGFSNFSREWEELSSQTKFLAVGSSLVHEKIVQIGPTILVLQEEGAGGGGGNK